MTAKRPIIDLNLSASEGEDHEGGSDIVQNHLQKRKRYQRLTPKQIKRLEEVFIRCPHPNVSERINLGNELGLEPLHVKFWFQNKRTNIKGKLNHQENRELQAEYDKLSVENMRCKEALKIGSCYYCGCLVAIDELEFQLLMENARLKQELNRIATIAANFVGKPVITNYNGPSPSSRNEN